MDDFQNFVLFWKDITIQIWALIVSQWILSISVLIVIIGYVISLVNSTRGSK